MLTLLSRAQDDVDESEAKVEATGAGAGAGAGTTASDDTTLAVNPTHAKVSPLQSMCVAALDTDGQVCYEHAAKPQLLLAAEALLRVLSDTAGEGQLAMCAARIPSASWWCARAGVAHQRSFSDGKPASSLWRLVTSGLRRAAAAFASPDVELVEEAPPAAAAPDELIIGEDGSISEPTAKRAGMPQASDAAPTEKATPVLRSEALRSCLLVEWAVAQRLFGQPDAASRSLMAAKSASGLRALLTGARGKKTK